MTLKLRKIEAVAPIHKNKRVCAYARVSTDSTKQEALLDNQIITYEKQICSNPEYEFVGMYADQGVSGYCENRPEFQRMMKDVHSGKIDLIITKSISRFARNTVTLLKFVRELQGNGVGIFFEEQNMNTLSAEGELMLTVWGAFAQAESSDISQNNRWSIAKRFERGEPMINTSRFMGYDKDETGDLIVNKKEAKVVRRIFEMYISGMGTHRIAKVLNEEEIPTVTGSPWNESTIRGMLMNEKYKGDFIMQSYFTPATLRNHRVRNRGQVTSYYISDNHPAIVTKEEWQQVQEMLAYQKEQRGIGNEDNKYQNRYDLSGMLVCPYCGKSLKRRYVYNKKVQWICSTYIQKGKQVCKGVRVDDRWLSKQSIKTRSVVEEIGCGKSKRYRLIAADYYDFSKTGGEINSSKDN